MDSPAPAHRAALDRRRAALDTWMVETGDLGAQPKPPEAVAPFEAGMREWFGTFAWARP